MFAFKMHLLMHTCQVLGKSKSEIARVPLIFAYNLVIEHTEKSGAQVWSMTVTQIKIQKGWISIGEKRMSNICNIR